MLAERGQRGWVLNGRQRPARGDQELESGGPTRFRRRIKRLSYRYMHKHGKSFLLGLVGTVQGRLGWAGQEAKELIPDLERIISESNWLETASFDTIHYVIRSGETAEETVWCRRNPKLDELEVASHLSMEDLHNVFLNRAELRRFLCAEIRRTLEHVQLKYDLDPLPELNEFFRLQLARRYPSSVERQELPNLSRLRCKVECLESDRKAAGRSAPW